MDDTLPTFTVRTLIEALQKKVKEHPSIANVRIEDMDGNDLATIVLHDPEGEGVEYVSIEPE